MALGWKSACLAGATPWVCFPAPHKPGLLAHACRPGSWKVDAGRPEVQSHPFIVALSQKNKVLSSSKVACAVCLSLYLLHSLVTKETEQKPAYINHPAAELRLLGTVTKAWLLGCGGLCNFLIYLLPMYQPLTLGLVPGTFGLQGNHSTPKGSSSCLSGPHSSSAVHL